MATYSRYTGGNSGWGTLAIFCTDCDTMIAEYECDQDGIPTTLIWSEEDTHVCPNQEQE